MLDLIPLPHPVLASVYMGLDVFVTLTLVWICRQQLKYERLRERLNNRKHLPDWFSGDIWSYKAKKARPFIPSLPSKAVSYRMFYAILSDDPPFVEIGTDFSINRVIRSAQSLRVNEVLEFKTPQALEHWLEESGVDWKKQAMAKWES